MLRNLLVPTTALACFAAAGCSSPAGDGGVDDYDAFTVPLEMLDVREVHVDASFPSDTLEGIVRGATMWNSAGAGVSITVRIVPRAEALAAPVDHVVHVVAVTDMHECANRMPDPHGHYYGLTHARVTCLDHTMIRRNGYDAAACYAHELGHSLGLGHLGPDTLMWYNAEAMALVTTSDDVDHLRQARSWFPRGRVQAGVESL